MSHFKAENASNSISAGAPSQTPLGELTALRGGEDRKGEKRAGEKGREKGKGKEEKRRGERGKEGGESGPPKDLVKWRHWLSS